MKEHNETLDLEHDAWEPLAAANMRTLNSFRVKPFGEAVGAARLMDSHEKQDEQRDTDSHRREGEKQPDEEQRRYVERGLQQIAKFERCARGLEVWPRRRRRC